MAAYPVNFAKSAQLVGATVDTITLLGGPFGAVEVWNRKGSADISFRLGGAGATPDPTDKGDDCFVVAAGQSASTGQISRWGAKRVEVKIVGNGNEYTVSAD